MNERTTSPAAVGVDGLLLLASSAVALWPLADVYDGARWAVAGLAGLALSAGVTLLARRLRWGPLLTVLAAAIGYLLVGPAAAAPRDAAAGVLPTLTAERALVTGIVESWRSVLTLPAPLGETRGELVVPFVIALIGGLISTTLLWRTRFAGTTWLPVAAIFVAAAAFGTRDATLPLARGLLLAVLLLVWLRWRALRVSPASWARRATLGAVVLALTAPAAWAVASMATPQNREVLRDHVDPPLAQLEFKSPLARYRAYYKEHKADVLFTFENLPAGEPLVRLAAMDSYDGEVWNVSTVDLLTGSSAFGPAPSGAGDAPMRVTVGDYAGPWVPTVGSARGAALASAGAGNGSRELLLNPATGAIAMYGDTRPGDVYDVDWSPRQQRTDELVTIPADLSVPIAPIEFAPIEKLDLLSRRWVARAGASTDYEEVVAIEQKFRDEGYFNDGLDPAERGYSASGHRGRRLADLIQDEKRMVGNDEQYAAAMAYAVQRLGIPARVVLGFEQVAKDGTVTGDDIAAWVEVPFIGRGWVPFDPTPSEDRKPPPQQDNPNPEPQPYVVQPPVLPQEPADIQGVPPAGAGRDDPEEKDDSLGAVLRWLWLLTRIVLALSPLWLVLLLKRVRRRRRHRALDPVDRLSGAWREVTDRARDLGVRPAVGATRHENGALLSDRFSTGEPVVLAVAADRHVFGPGVPSDEDVEAFWSEADAAIKAMRRSVPMWRRPVAVLSPVSLPWRETGARARGRLGRVLGAMSARLGSLRPGSQPRPLLGPGGQP